MKVAKIIIRNIEVRRLIDILLLPLTYIGGMWLRIVKYVGLLNFPLTRSTLYSIGVFPIVDHYYEPQFNFKGEKDKLNKARDLPSIDFNIEFQIAFLDNLDYQNELETYLQRKPNDKQSYYFNNGSFNSGDAEFYYSLIRYLKPQTIVEVGSGYSTLVALEAMNANLDEGDHETNLICIEPYEMPWLKELNIDLIRQKVEDTNIDLYRSLEEGDILFIDSSHVIRPNGDVLYEILQILPQLGKGVYIHFHDIFTPYNYPYEWLEDEDRLWNEQFVLEAFLSFNNSFEVVAMLHYLFRHQYDLLSRKFPGVERYPNKAPGSFWIRKRSSSQS